jgi:tripartite-type tricarboxylate transporter receptor subunit TctC
MNRRHLLAAAGLLAAPPIHRAAAQAGATAPWAPDRPIRLVYPYPPGGGGDIVSRLLAERARDLLGQPVLVENRPGAAGLVGAELVTRAPKDGQTLLVTAAALSIAPSVYRRITFDPTKDLAAVALLTRLPLMVLTRPESPLKSFGDLVAAAKRDGDRITYGSFGIGSPPHLVGERINQDLGLSMTHVPYTGGAVALPAILSGDLSIGIFDGMSMMPHVKAGRLRCLALTAATRIPQLPEVPTLRENGVPHDIGTWHGAFVPGGTPAPIIARLNEVCVQVMAMPEVRDRVVGGGAVPVEPPLSPAGWAQAFAEEVEAWAAVARRARVVVE